MDAPSRARAGEAEHPGGFEPALLRIRSRSGLLGGAAVVGSPTLDGGVGHRNSSPGAYGAYPFIDWDGRYFGILARQGPLGTFREGDALYQTVAEDIARWANACDE